jgi:hypothetical protein
VPAAAEQSADPIFAVIEAYDRADAAENAHTGDEDIPDHLGDATQAAQADVLRTRPTTPAGLAALTTWARGRAEWHRDNGTEDNDLMAAIATAIDNAVKALIGRLA